MVALLIDELWRPAGPSPVIKLAFPNSLRAGTTCGAAYGTASSDGVGWFDCVIRLCQRAVAGIARRRIRLRHHADAAAAGDRSSTPTSTQRRTARPPQCPGPAGSRQFGTGNCAE